MLTCTSCSGSSQLTVTVLRRVRAARRSVAVRAETADVEGTKLDLGDAESEGGQAHYAGIVGGACPAHHPSSEDTPLFD